MSPSFIDNSIDIFKFSHLNNLKRYLRFEIIRKQTHKLNKTKKTRYCRPLYLTQISLLILSHYFIIFYVFV